MVVSAGANPVIKENNFLENETADVEITEYAAENLKLDFTRNWWGETAPGVIEERILDALDDPTKGAYAVVDPVLTAATPMPRPGGP
jgi:hypothetical protein